MNDATQDKLSEICSNSFRALTDLELFIRVAMEGFVVGELADEMHDLIRSSSLKAVRETAREDSVWATETRKRLGEFSKKEKTRGFSFLFGLSSVRVWTILEAMIGDYLVTLIENENDLLERESIKKLKGPLIEFAAASRGQQAEYLSDLLIQDLKAKLKPGIGRFETILNEIGFGGGVNPHVARILLELSQLRNIILHKNGRVDARFVEFCPQKNVKTGEEILISENDFGLYYNASFWYVIEVFKRFISPSSISHIERFSGHQEGYLTRIDTILKKTTAT